MLKTIRTNKFSGLFSVPIFSHILTIIDELSSSEKSTKICDIYDRMPPSVEVFLFARILEALCSDGKIAFDIERNQFYINDILKYDQKKFILLKKKYGSSGYSGILAHPSHYRGSTEGIEQHIKALEEGDKVIVGFLERTLFSSSAILADKQFYEVPGRKPKINFEKITNDCTSKTKGDR